MSDEKIEIKKTNYPNIILKAFWIICSILVIFNEIFQLLQRDVDSFVGKANLLIRIPVIIITLFSILLINKMVNSKENKLSKKIIIFIIYLIVISILWSLSDWVFSTMCGNCGQIMSY